MGKMGKMGKTGRTGRALGSGRDRILAPGIQRRATEEITGRADARAVREATGREAAYNAGGLWTHLLLKAGGRRTSDEAT